MVNQMVMLPLFALIIILAFGIHKELAVGMMILASCPGGVTSNMISKLAGGDSTINFIYRSCQHINNIYSSHYHWGVDKVFHGC